MANTVIQLKKSSTPGSSPSTGNLANGELAINFADGIIYYKNLVGQVAQFTAPGKNYGTVNANGTLLVSGIAGDVFTILPGQNITVTGDAVNDRVTIGADLTSANGWSNTKLANTSGVSFAGDLYFPTGKVGIGTTTPTANLDVSTGGGGAGFKVYKDYLTYIAAPGGQSCYWDNTGLAINSSVGRNYNLYVNGTGYFGQRLYLQSSIDFTVAGGEAAKISSPSSDVLVFSNSGGERLRINSSGFFQFNSGNIWIKNNDANNLYIGNNGAGTTSQYGISIRPLSGEPGLRVSEGIALGQWSQDGYQDVFLRRDAANVLALRNGAAAQAFNAYNTYTDASNYERGALLWSGNIFYVGTEAAGTGTRRSMSLAAQTLGFVTGSGDGAVRWNIDASGHFLGNADNTYDIGANGANRPRNVYVGSTVSASGVSSTNMFVTNQYILYGSDLGTHARLQAGSAPGCLVLKDRDQTSWDRLQFGGTTSAFPALKRSGTTLQVRLADDSGDANISAANATFSGSVGVGTASPVRKLSIYSIDSDNSLIRLHAASSTIGNVYRGGLEFYGPRIDSVSDEQLLGRVYAYNTTTAYGSSSLVFQTNSGGKNSLSDTLILSNGVTYTKYLVSSIANDGTAANFTTTTGPIVGTYNQILLSFGNEYYNAGGIRGIYENYGGYGKLSFLTNYAGTLNERMTISSAGNVGIGTTTPTAKLHVAGDAIFTGNVTVSGNTSYMNTQTLLIGDNLITLNADLPVGSPATEDAGIEVNRGAYGNASIVWDETNDRWDVRANSNNLVSILSTGNIGIGTSSPTTNIHIATDAPSIRQTLKTQTTTTGAEIGRFEFENGSGSGKTPKLTFAYDGSNINNYVFGIYPHASSSYGPVFQAGTNGSYYVNIDGSLNIQNSNPINLYGTSGTTTGIQFVGSSAHAIKSTDYWIDVIGNSAQIMRWFNGSTEVMRIAPNSTSANVGIGTTTPTSKLHVVGTGNITSNLVVQGYDVVPTMFALANASNNWANTIAISSAIGNSTNTQVIFNNNGYANGSNDLLFIKGEGLLIANVISSNTMFVGRNQMDSTQILLGAAGSYTIDKFLSSSAKAVQYNLVFESEDRQYHSTQISLLHNDGTSYITEYATLYTGNNLATITSSLSSMNVYLNVATTYANTVVNIFRVATGIDPRPSYYNALLNADGDPVLARDGSGIVLRS